MASPPLEVSKKRAAAPVKPSGVPPVPPARSKIPLAAVAAPVNSTCAPNMLSVALPPKVNVPSSAAPLIKTTEPASRSKLAFATVANSPKPIFATPCITALAAVEVSLNPMAPLSFIKVPFAAEDVSKNSTNPLLVKVALSAVAFPLKRTSPEPPPFIAGEVTKVLFPAFALSENWIKGLVAISTVTVV